MNTTLLFAELLIIGLQASLWLFLLALLSFGVNWLQSLKAIGLADWQTVIVVVALSIVYVIGIIVDRLADLVFSSWDKRIRDSIIPKAPVPIAVMRFQLGKDNEYLNRQFEYTRTRMRISRASILNFALSTVFGVWLIFQQLSNSADKTRFVVIILSFGLLLTLSAVYTWQKLTRTYFGLVKSNWELVSETQIGKKKGISVPIESEKLRNSKR